MYQTFVIGLGFLVVIGLGYFIHRTDTSGLIIDKTPYQEVSSSTSPVVQLAAGTYLCDVDSKCTVPYVLTVQEGGEATLTTSFENGAEVLTERGTWKIEEGKLVLVLTGTDTLTYELGVTLRLEKSGTTSLRGVSTSDASRKGWVGGLFLLQGVVQEG